MVIGTFARSNDNLGSLREQIRSDSPVVGPSKCIDKYNSQTSRHQIVTALAPFQQFCIEVQISRQHNGKDL